MTDCIRIVDIVPKKTISRAAAKRLGRMHYFTGKPCCHGHICLRYVLSKHCVRCQNKLNRSPEGLEALRRWCKGPKGKEAFRRYWRSPKGRENQRKTDASPLGVERRRRFDSSPKKRAYQRDRSHTRAYRDKKNVYERNRRLVRPSTTTTPRASIVSSPTAASVGISDARSR